MSTAPGDPLAVRLTSATAGCGDVAALARLVFDVVGAAVPFAFACLATIDPASGLVTGAFKSRPLPVGDEEFAAAEYGGPDVNRLAELAQRRVPVGALSLDTGGRPDRSRRFREFMAPRFGFTDEVRLVCRAGSVVWAALALYRGEGEPAFTEAEARLLGAAHGSIALAVRRALSAEPEERAESGGTAVLVVDAEDRVTDRSASADVVVEDLGGWDHGALPANLLAAAATARTSLVPTASSVRARSGCWLSVRAVPLTGTARGRSVVLSVEPAAHAAVGRIVLAASGLTVREADVVALVLRGASTKTIASTLHLSPLTVQDHLKAVFDKLGISSRRELIARFVA